MAVNETVTAAVSDTAATVADMAVETAAATASCSETARRVLQMTGNALEGTSQVLQQAGHTLKNLPQPSPQPVTPKSKTSSVHIEEKFCVRPANWLISLEHYYVWRKT